MFLGNHDVCVVLVDRGFTQAFQALESEKAKDRTKKFEVSRIVDVSGLLFIIFASRVFVKVSSVLCLLMY